MSKKQSENKAKLPDENKAKAGGGKKVQIRLRPGRGVGGIGVPGTVAWVEAEAAKHWVETGYADYVNDKPEEVESTAAAPLSPSRTSPQIEERDLGGEEEGEE